MTYTSKSLNCRGASVRSTARATDKGTDPNRNRGGVNGSCTRGRRKESC